MKNTLITSALAELTLAVFLGWPLQRFRSGRTRVGPFHSMKRLLQAHLDYVFMALLQLAVAAAHPAIPPIAGWLLVVGSWTNPSLFLLGGILPPERERDASSIAFTMASFALLTVAYPWLLYAWLTR
jgi:hypothetical protein